MVLMTNSKPNIMIFATGGTIAGIGNSSITSTYKAGILKVEDLILGIDKLNDIANIKTMQLSNIGSQDMDFKIWEILLNNIDDLSNNNSYDGVVIIHGTDTLEETAYFLNLTIKTNKPVVLVGAMRPSTALSADGPRNIYNAVVCAANKDSYSRGVMIVMNDKILGADDICKMDTLSTGSFCNPNYGPLGYIYNNKPVFTRSSNKLHTLHSIFNLNQMFYLPRVDIILGYVNSDTIFIDTAVKAGAKGIIYAGVGNGNVSNLVLQKLSEIAKKGIIVIRSSRISTGPTCLWDEIDDDEFNFAASWFLTPQKARILLMLCLTITNDFKVIQNFFDTY
ncbi:l-asparaginase ii [Vairimorpha apis BRL 01]|uniref:asparaginase n=1 Tax=Vairimorpha apis BRL 01 TaxID=1037528 RepID=T0LD27_9MICR|nr:l-asparaginase ii [Vairimorpha apis BRL 01]